jgi:hypothetical protein
MASVASSPLTLDDARVMIARRFAERSLERMESTIILLTIACGFDSDDLQVIMHEEVAKLDHAGQTYWLGEDCDCGNPGLHGE